MASQLSRLGTVSQQFLKVCVSGRSQQWTRQLHKTRLVMAVTEVKMPALSPTMQEGTIVKWYKKEGEAVAPGDILCDIQTDKAVVSFEMEEEGILAKVLKPDNTKDIKIGSLIALMVDEGEDWQNVEVPESTAAVPPSAPPPSEPAVSPVTAKSSSSPHSQGYGPAVRSLLDIYNLKIDQVPASGPHGRLLKGDILRYVKDKNLQPVPPPTVPLPKAVTAVAQPVAPPVAAPVKTPAAPVKAPRPVSTEGYEDLELTSMRKTIARRLTESKTTIPHAYSTADCNMTALTALRKEFLADGVKVSVNDFIIKAVAVALQKVPECNAIYSAQGPQLLQAIDISVAVATDNGLITPIVKDAIGLGVKEISENVKELAGRARQGRLQLHEFQGGSFTISNLGMFGISEFSAVINPPQACIMAVGGSRVVLDSETEMPKTLMSVTLSSDARVVDDYIVARFLEAFQEVMENPMMMLSQSKTPDLSRLFAK